MVQHNKEDVSRDLVITKTTGEVEHAVLLQVVAADSDEKNSSPITESNQLIYGEDSVNSSAVLTITGGQKSAPMGKLHAIVSHNIQVEKGITIEQYDDKIENPEDIPIEDKEEDDSDQTILNICKEAGISPHVLTKGKKVKVKKDSESKPTRLQAKGVEKIKFK